MYIEAVAVRHSPPAMLLRESYREDGKIRKRTTARVDEPASKLATHRMLHNDTAVSSLGRVLGVGQCDADDLYRALDWLHDARPVIERRRVPKPFDEAGVDIVNSAGTAPGLRQMMLSTGRSTRPLRRSSRTAAIAQAMKGMTWH